MTEPLSVNDDTIARLRKEAGTMRDDVIALRFRWELPYLHEVARRHGITLTTESDYLRAHPNVVARASAALAPEGPDARRRYRKRGNDPRPRDCQVTFWTVAQIDQTISAAADKRNISRSALVADVVEKIAMRNLWDEILK